MSAVARYSHLLQINRYIYERVLFIFRSTNTSPKCHVVQNYKLPVMTFEGKLIRACLEYVRCAQGHLCIFTIEFSHLIRLCSIRLNTAQYIMKRYRIRILFCRRKALTHASNLSRFTHLWLESSRVAVKNAGNCSDMK